MVTTVEDAHGTLYECDLCTDRYTSQAAAQDCEAICDREDHASRR